MLCLRTIKQRSGRQTGTNPALTSHLTLCVGRALLKPTDKPCWDRDSPGTGLWLHVQQDPDRNCLFWPFLGGKELLVFCSHPTAFPGASAFMESSHCPSQEKRSSWFSWSHPTTHGAFPFHPAQGSFHHPIYSCQGNEGSGSETNQVKS